MTLVLYTPNNITLDTVKQDSEGREEGTEKGRNRPGSRMSVQRPLDSIMAYPRANADPIDYQRR